jgi:NADH:ubiquinone oxidoreductase subunit 6 (subunit J)
MLGQLKDAAAVSAAAEAIAAADAELHEPTSVLSRSHMANLGRHLFAEHLISVEVAGTLLLAALVGAIAIASFGKPRLETRVEEALR